MEDGACSSVVYLTCFKKHIRSQFGTVCKVCFCACIFVCQCCILLYMTLIHLIRQPGTNCTTEDNRHCRRGAFDILSEDICTQQEDAFHVIGQFLQRKRSPQKLFSHVDEKHLAFRCLSPDQMVNLKASKSSNINMTDYYGCLTSHCLSVF